MFKAVDKFFAVVFLIYLQRGSVKSRSSIQRQSKCKKLGLYHLKRRTAPFGKHKFWHMVRKRHICIKRSGRIAIQNGWLKLNLVWVFPLNFLNHTIRTNNTEKVDHSWGQCSWWAPLWWHFTWEYRSITRNRKEKSKGFIFCTYKNFPFLWWYNFFMS